MQPLPLRVPELVPGIDVRSLPLSAVEGFVLSRIDGRVSVSEIVSLTGLGADMVGPIVEKLVALGAVRWQGATAPVSQTRLPVSAPVAKQPPAVTTAPPSVSGQHRAITASGPAPARSSTSSASLPPAPGAPARAPSSPGHPPTASTPPRKRPHSGPPRRAMAESAISQAPPDFRPSQRPGPASSPPHGAHGHAPSSRRPSEAAPSHPPRSGGGHQTVDPIRDLFESFEDRERTQPRIERPAASSPPVTNKLDAIPPGPPSSPELFEAMFDVDLPYDPNELREEVDLPFARRKEVLDLYYRLEQVDHYELLGIGYDAEKKDVRAAYFSLSKVFHPDTMFRKNLGTFKAKMEAVFRQLTEAYETLGKKKTREEYDGYLRATKKTQMAERTLSFEANRAKVNVEQKPQITAPKPQAAAPVAPRPPQPPPEPSAPPRPVTDEARKLAQQIMQRRLKSAVGEPGSAARSPAPTPSMAPPAPSVPPPPRTDPQELLRRLTRTLKDVGAITGTSDQLTRHVRGSQTAFARGDLAEATREMQRAASMAPERLDLRAEYERLSRMLSEKLAADYEEQAKFEQKANKWASAALSWAKVCEGKPEDAGAHKCAAHALFKAGGDLRGAQKYAQQAVFLASGDIEAHILLAQIYLTIGLKLNAKRELDTASKLDPGNEMVKNLLADMKS